MTFRERLDNNFTLFVLGLLLAGFLAGIGAYGFLQTFLAQAPKPVQKEDHKYLITIVTEDGGGTHTEDGVVLSYGDMVFKLDGPIGKKNMSAVYDAELTKNRKAGRVESISINTVSELGKYGEDALHIKSVTIRENGVVAFYCLQSGWIQDQPNEEVESRALMVYKCQNTI